MVRACQVDENDHAEVVVLCKPALPKMMGTLHPAGSLYEKPVNTEMAKQQHEAFREKLESHNIRVVEVGETMAKDTDTNINARIALEEFAMKSLTYEFEEGMLDETTKEDMYYIGDQYKRNTIEAMSAEQLVDIIMTRPTVTLIKSYRDTGFTASHSFRPLANIVFTRDQQVRTSDPDIKVMMLSILNYTGFVGDHEKRYYTGTTCERTTNS